MTTQRIILVVVPIPDKPEEFAGFQTPSAGRVERASSPDTATRVAFPLHYHRSRLARNPIPFGMNSITIEIYK